MSEKKHLYRDTQNQKIFGVAKGLADYFDLDVVLVRVIWLILVLCAGTGLLAYLIMAIVVEPKEQVMARIHKDEVKKAEANDDPFAKYDK
ncbi:MAG: PspC domain-containing protein [Firmicutes bacterium]|nr:PspC domain-containing protein [Bacillota bacterium]